MKTVLIGGPLEGIIEQRCSAQYIRVLENDSGYYKISYATGEIRQYVWTPGRVEENFKGTTTLSAVPLSGGAQEGAHWAPPVGTLKPLQMRDSGGVPTPAPPSLEGGPAGSGHPVGSLHPDRAESTLFGLIGELEAETKTFRKESEYEWGKARGLRMAVAILERELRTLEEERKAETRESEAPCMCETEEGEVRPCPPTLCERPDHKHLQDASDGNVDLKVWPPEDRPIGTFTTSELELLGLMAVEAYLRKAPRSRADGERRFALREKILDIATCARHEDSSDGATKLWSLEPRESERTES
jgi:hypothetical protein